MKTFEKSKLNVQIYETRAQMGAAAAEQGAACLKKMLEEKESINVMFAAAPSQNELLAGLVASDVDWSRVNAYHMDDYVGLPEDDSRRFPNFLKERLFDKLPFRSVHCMPSTKTPEDGVRAAAYYDELLRNNPLDACFMGIGENGHIAFNDPQVADFNDPYWTKVVELDDVCRMQQVHDGCFASMDEVPTQAMTVTIPALLSAKEIFCIVPAATKAAAVDTVLQGVIKIECPATALLEHPSARLYLDADSAGKWA
ncbi:MAG: 6-phosphogluconolactonase [Oscillospiraceae bacterium]|nr:6-phosphogluconolactonase [Oscillospiraceae bacterium]